MATYALLWNPTKGPRVPLAVEMFGDDDEPRVPSWSVSNGSRIGPGDRFFLFRVGPKPRGVVGAGWVQSPPLEGEHWDPRRREEGATDRYVDLHIDFLHEEPVLFTEDLARADDWFANTIRSSGREIPADAAQVLEDLWAEAVQGPRLAYLFNNFRNRPHAEIYGKEAFFDLNTDGRHARLARDLVPGDVCVVASSGNGVVTFDWHSFSHEEELRDEQDVVRRVFFGPLLTSEVLPKAEAARTPVYANLFTVSGDFKRQSAVLSERPLESPPAQSLVDAVGAGGRGGSGFGDPAHNQLVERRAIERVTWWYEARDWTVRSVERENCGFDLLCVRGDRKLEVEVKGVRGTNQSFIITHGEVERAQSSPAFVLAVVTSALSRSPELHSYTGREFQSLFKRTPIQYRALLRSDGAS